MTGEKKYLFFDIDGTIFDDHGNLPDSVLPAMLEARRNGHELFINTGRTLCNRDRRLDGFPLDGWIMGCGTRTIYHGRTLSSMEYDPERTLRLLEIFRGLEIPTVFECDTGLYFDPKGAAHPEIVHFQSFAEKHGLRRFISEGDPEFRAVKMFCFAEKRDSIEALERAAAEAGMPYKGIDRGNGGWEMVPGGFSKGRGMDALLERLGAKRENSFAFGDSRNDLSMFEHAGCAVAMGNAPEEIRAVCSYVTARPEEDGIRKAMRHFGMI